MEGADGRAISTQQKKMRVKDIKGGNPARDKKKRNLLPG